MSVEKIPSQEKESRAYYVPEGIPAEMPRQKDGKMVGIFSIICAVIAIIFYPIIFGPLGIALGIMAINRGRRTLGIVGVILSSVFMVIGFILGFASYQETDVQGHILFGIFS